MKLLKKNLINVKFDEKDSGKKTTRMGWKVGPTIAILYPISTIWSVTHTPTGLAVYLAFSREDAIRAAKYLRRRPEFRHSRAASVKKAVKANARLLAIMKANHSRHTWESKA